MKMYHNIKEMTLVCAEIIFRKSQEISWMSLTEECAWNEFVFKPGSH